jgi:hypothetical protein
MANRGSDAYRHRFPEGEDERLHNVSDGAYCPCAPRVQNLPLVVADKEGYAQIIHHASMAARRAGRPSV